jgi:CHASE2 domain-containing sensor protein
MQIGGVILPKLTANAGGYALPPEEVEGYQILVNYRSTDPQQISLADVLNGSLDPQLAQLVRDRIILIGVSDTKDSHLTSYSRGTIPNKMPGVILQAHMTSQIISAVLDHRPLIWWLPEWGELLWIGTWSLVGGLLTWQLWQRSPLALGLTLCITCISLWGLCYLFLLRGGWIPLIPSAFALIATSGWIIAVIFLHVRNTQSAA